jgi:hypothetical protein
MASPQTGSSHMELKQVQFLSEVLVGEIQRPPFEVWPRQTRPSVLMHRVVPLFVKNPSQNSPKVQPSQENGVLPSSSSEDETAQSLLPFPAEF